MATIYRCRFCELYIKFIYFTIEGAQFNFNVTVESAQFVSIEILFVPFEHRVPFVAARLLRRLLVVLDDQRAAPEKAYYDSAPCNELEYFDH